ncbi:MAG: tripartite tricarboxylate transporter TctB family protein [Rhodospirillales bacterium]
MGRKNVIAGIVLLAIGLGYGYLSLQLPVRAIEGVPGPSFFPILIALSLSALAAALTWQGIARRRAEAHETTERLVTSRQFAMLGIFAAYLAALPFLGFLAAGIPFFAGLVFVYGGLRPIPFTLAAAGIPVGLFFLFRHVFQIPLPRGTLEILGG